MTSTHLSTAVLAFLSLARCASSAEPVPPGHAANMAASEKLFREKVRPFLIANCLECHGGARPKSGFDLGTREALLKGGERGVAVVPGKGRGSPLVRSVARLDEPHMPPKVPVAKESVDLLSEWIDLGAAYDRPLGEARVGPKPAMAVTDKDRQYWAYRALQRVEPPAVRDANWARNPIDRFILSKLETRGIVPSVDANPRTLLRRATFDVVGLPPTPEDVEAFAADPSPKAYEKAIDRLLASPHYGERWGRHWLDPSRFAESHGFEHDTDRKFAYHYRDFVVKALNDDMPYDRFVRWQVAGDELAPGDPMALAATGFLGAGVFPTQITTAEAERVRYDSMDDMLATAGHAFLALTVGCARCHDHKYDPIPTRDYYRMLSAFTTTVRTEVAVEVGTEAEKAAMRAFEATLKPFEDEKERLEAGVLPHRLAGWIALRKSNGEKLPPKAADKRATEALRDIWEGRATVESLAAPSREAAVKWFAPMDADWSAAEGKVKALEMGRPKETRATIQACTEGLEPVRLHKALGTIPDFYPETHVLNRGDTAQKLGIADQGFLQVLSRSPEGEKRWLARKPDGSRTSFRRAGLAAWLTDAEFGAGALAARAAVNRLWHHHFGRGIVSTLNDFGLQGDPPTHPELLEWLANDLVAHGWSLKRLHRQILMSHAYRLSGAVTDTGNRLDPDNRLWHSRPRRRLEAEAIRDALLAVSGQLDPTMYGPGTLDPAMRRRSIYFTVKRSQLVPMLQIFDWPDTLTSAAARPTTAVAPQALYFLNNPHVRRWADGLASRLGDAAGTGFGAAIDRAYLIAYARHPTAEEIRIGLAFLAEREGALGRKERALREYALALVSGNEFIAVD